MLEVKNLTKIYKTKGGAEVRALDNVSLSFAEKGMVFLLGKSGSGKSTLLNICGGLDAPDSGEIIVKGKSSKDFSAGDFDSYRNTYVGFIFQEYNILNEFSIEDNIALALELQGKPKDKQEIARLLDEVELTNFAKRKPNTLSGGQKQRVAIARALVKNPEIIMADEPTGALDSNTGKQVFDTLKKLSRDKLVIVVSHDRDFAEEYADRIIELRDGKVISDVIKESVPPVVKDENVSIVGDNTIFIKKGSKLSTQDFTKIKKFVAECDNDVLISKEQSDIANYKKANKINDDNSKEQFTVIPSQPKQKSYSSEENKFIRSKLPLRHALKIGASSIKVKPVRFLFTVFLSVVSFVLFGLFSCLMLYNPDEVKVQSLKDSEIQYLDMYKTYDVITSNYEIGRDEPWSYTQSHNANMSDNEINDIRKTFGDNVIPVYKIASCSIDNLYVNNLIQSLYTSNINGFISADSPINYIAGTKPQGENQIAISEYLYNSIKNGELKDENQKVIKINTFSDIIIQIKNKSYSVSGIFQSEKIMDKYKELDKKTDYTGGWGDTLRSGFYSYVAIDPACVNSFGKAIGYQNTEIPQTSFGGTFLRYSYAEENNGSMSNSFVRMDGNTNYYNSSCEKVSASGSEKMSVMLDYSNYFKVLRGVLEIFTDRNKPEYNEAFANEYYSSEITANELYALADGNYYSETEMIAAAKKVLDITNKYFRLENLNFKITNFVGTQSIAEKAKIVGFYQNTNQNVGETITYLSNDLADIYKEHSINANGMYSENICNYAPANYEANNYAHVFLSTNNNASQIRNILKYKNTTSENNDKFSVQNGLLTQITLYNSMVDILSKVFLWIGIVLAIFSMLLLFNFITASISAKKKEIGILRAVGARGTDVFKIFFSEAFIIVIICIVLSIILTSVFAGLINNSIQNQLGIPFAMFTFGIISVAMIAGIALVSAFISTFLPVYSNAKKKPVESIRSL